jgi:myo-inositol-1(or 4)-monophosphatase
MYSALKNQGAFHNNNRIRTSNQADLKQSLIVTEYNADSDHEMLTNKANNIINLLSIPIHGIRSFGSAAFDMCTVADGTSDAYYEWGIHCWDIAAGIIIVQEAGGHVITPSSKCPVDTIDIFCRKIICTGSQSLAEQLHSMLDSHVFLEADNS